MVTHHRRFASSPCHGRVLVLLILSPSRFSLSSSYVVLLLLLLLFPHTLDGHHPSPFNPIQSNQFHISAWVVVPHGVIGTKRINRISNPGIVVAFRNRKFVFLMSVTKVRRSICFRTSVIWSVTRNNRSAVKPSRRAGSPLTNI